MKLSFTFNGKPHEGVTENVSTGGFFVRLPAILPIGANIPFSLSHEKMKNPFKVVGKVVHLKTSVEEEDVGIGVQLQQFGKDQEENFDAYRKVLSDWIAEHSEDD